MSSQFHGEPEPAWFSDAFAAFSDVVMCSQGLGSHETAGQRPVLHWHSSGEIIKASAIPIIHAGAAHNNLTDVGFVATESRHPQPGIRTTRPIQVAKNRETVGGWELRIPL